MTIALIMSADRLEEEHAMLSRLTVGLINEGHQVVRVVPEVDEDALPEYEQSLSLAKRIMAPMPTSYFQRKNRQVDVSTVLQQEHVETIVAFGKDALQLALDVKEHIHVPVLFEIQSEREIKKVKSHSSVNRWFTSSHSFERLLVQQIGLDRSAYVPFGVRNTSTEHSTSTTDPCAVILDAASDLKETRAVLSALKHHNNMHIFVELMGKHQHRVWKLIRNFNMLDQVSCLQNVGDIRSLVVESDLLLIPNHSMQMRSVVLEAMSNQVPIVSANMQGYDMLINEETALTSDQDWTSQINRIIEDRRFASQLGRNGADLIHEKYGSMHQIAAFEAAISLI